MDLDIRCDNNQCPPTRLEIIWLTLEMEIDKGRLMHSRLQLEDAAISVYLEQQSLILKF